MKYQGTELNWYTVGFAFDRDYKNVVLIEKKKQWCYGLLNGVGGSIEESDNSPLDAQRREFFEETGLHLRNWEFFCQLREPHAVVEFFRTTVPFDLLRTVKTTTVEPVHIVNVELMFDLDIRVMPNLAWLIPMAQSKCGIIAQVAETTPLVGLCKPVSPL